MMRMLENMNIQRKLVFIIMLTCAVVILLIGATATVMTQNTLRDAMLKNMFTQAEIMAENCKAAVTFDSASDAEDILDALATQPSIISASIHKSDGSLFAVYNREKSNKVMHSEYTGQSGHSFRDGFLFVLRNIVLDGDKIGTLSIKSDLSPLRAAFRRNIMAMFAVLAAAAMIAYLLSIRLQRIISGPILNLAEVAKAVSENREYSARAVKQTNDEIGLLIDSFNEMLEQIQQRDEAMTGINEQLEIKVEERTKKLNESNKQLEQFTYIASHDLREPLRKITSFGSILRGSLQDKVSGDDIENLNFMIDGAERMQKMIEALLSYSRVTTKGGQFEPLDLNDVVKQLEEFELSVTIEETKTKIEIPQPLPQINGDVAQIRQLLQNL